MPVPSTVKALASLCRAWKELQAAEEQLPGVVKYDHRDRLQALSAKPVDEQLCYLEQLKADAIKATTAIYDMEQQMAKKNGEINMFIKDSSTHSHRC
ncbi:unnamed protein product [Vitrella brassicaformis CCMP3155]|uniref:Uncharacterized protein n=1 Tax=Vitrella brassicaformis (strain CCMP3155) TaxID=1169540 RepID=A0A0G4E8B9_VITBC|nr:unnamed protein product [Vitrella brassicaformis CCMP3155]|eukprot:CEL91661.1 unnamed protein product [Vitrella brassicaformis CCMP3155]